MPKNTFINKFLLNFFILGFISIAVVSFSHTPVTAQDSTNWAPARRIVGYDDDVLPPYLVADQNKTVHAFTSQWVGDEERQLAIVYSTWSLENGWSQPTDILLSPWRQARLNGVFLDKSGIIHVMFFGGDDEGASIYYSRASIVDAGQAKSWTTPLQIGERAITPSFAALAGDDAGHLIVIYSGNIGRIGLYAVHSYDNGDTWSDPDPIFFDDSGELYPAWLHISMGQSGKVYAVWNTVNSSGLNISGHFVKYDIASKTWSEPIEFTKGSGIEEGMGIMNPAVMEYKNKIIIRYNNGIPPSGVPPSEWIQESLDGGNTWSTPLRPFSHHVGRNGVATFTVDSTNNLHLLFAMRRPGEINGQYYATGGIWYSSLNNYNSWDEPELVANNNSYGDLVFDGYDAKAVIVQGNVLLATWRSDPGGDAHGVWYTYKVLDKPELPVIPYPTQTLSSIATNLSKPTPTATPIDDTATPTTKFTFEDTEPDTNLKVGTNPVMSLSLSMLPVVLLVAIIVIVTIIRRNPGH